jgi:hypothetical protein
MSRLDRRVLIATGLVAAAAASPLRALAQQDDYPDNRSKPAPGPGGGDRDHYTAEEVVHAGSDFLGVTAEAMGGAIERIAKDNGRRPTGYIAGTEGSAAFVGGVRYGKGVLYLKHQDPREVYWQGPSIGFDWGGNAARNFTLCYNLDEEKDLYRRFPGVEGSAYLVGGIGVNYQKAEDIVLAPMRAGVGLRLGANIGYLAYSKSRHILPF